MAPAGPARLRVLHLNLAAGFGVGHCGALFADALGMHPEIDLRALYLDRLAEEGPPVSDLVRRPGWFPLAVTGPLTRLRTLAGIVGHALRFRPDVIHDTSGSAMWMGALAWPLLARLAPLVVTEHDAVPHSGMGGPLHERYSRWAARAFAHRIVVLGPRSGEQLRDLGVPSRRIVVDRLGDFGPLMPPFTPVSRDPATVLFFGSMRPNKGFDLLLPIADRLAGRLPGLRFLVAGSPSLPRSLARGPWPERRDALLAEMRLRPDFEVHAEHVADADLHRFFHRATVTLLPYRDATQSGVAMLAMAGGSLLVATEVGDLPDVLGHGERGILAAPDPEGLAAAIVRALSDPTERERRVEAARRFAAGECAWTKIVDRLLPVYRELARSGS